MNETPTAEAVPASIAPAVVAGFKVPANLRYHPYTWVLNESPNLDLQACCWMQSGTTIQAGAEET